MALMKIIGVAFVAAFASILLKNAKPELSFAVNVTGVIVILLFIVDSLQGALSTVSAIAGITGIENGLLKILLKIVGVGYITEFGCGILNDFGSNALADKVSLGGKVAIVLLSIPVLESLLQLVKGFVQLI